jgi:hypothetical protein
MSPTISSLRKVSSQTISFPRWASFMSVLSPSFSEKEKKLFFPLPPLPIHQVLEQRKTFEE